MALSQPHAAGLGPARGAALLVGLVILVLITLLALLAARLALLQERAVAAQRASGTSLQQAEAALVSAEQWLASRPAGSLCAGTGASPVHWQHDDALVARFADPERWPGDIGRGQGLLVPPAATGAREARYLIEAIAFVADPAEIPGAAATSDLAALLACDADASPMGIAYFRISARGTGTEPFVDDAPLASSVVQSIYAVRVRGDAVAGEEFPRRIAWRELD